MYTFSKWALALSFPLIALGATAAQPAPKGNRLPDITKMQYQARNYKTLFNSERNARIDGLNKRLAAGKKSISTPDFSLPLTDQYEYIDGPNGSIYFCASEFETEDVKYDYYTEKEIKAFKFTIYDSDFKNLGEIKGKVHLDTTTNPENPEIRVASLGISPIITRKFFNYDDKLEVMVYFNMNTPNYTVNSRSVAYQIGGEKDEEGYDVPLCTINGNLCDVLEANTSKWSEDFYLTFASDYNFPIEEGDESYTSFVNSYGVQIESYKKVAYGTSEPQKIFDYKMRLNDWPGDQESATPFISRNIDGKPYFAINGYTKGLFVFGEVEDDYSIPEQVYNEDTNFFVDIYQPESLDNPNLVQHTEIEMVKTPGDNISATFYYLGALGYRDDINFDYCDEEGKANLVITTRDWDGAEIATTASYYLYTPDGKLDATIGRNIEGVVQMSDIDGQEPQFLFVSNFNSEYTFDFVNPYTGVNHHSFGQVLEWNGEYEGLYVNVDRVADGDSYKYCFELSTPGLDDDGNDYMRVAWVSQEGKIISVDEINMGQNVRMAKVYIGQEVLSPFFFNTNSEREYMIIVKRGEAFSSATHEEFLIGTASDATGKPGEILLELKPDDELGNLIQVATMDGNTSPILWAMYYNNTSDKYSQLFYNLPLKKFQGGDGSLENPYQIASAGDLQSVRENLSAHYEVVSDFDASDIEIAPLGGSSAPFIGTIKGNGHTISNLTIGGTAASQGLFSYISNSSISDLTFVHPTIKINESTDKAGLIAGTMQQTTLTNIHVIGLTVDSNADISFGGLAANANLKTAISGCSVTNASINLPGATNVGGLVGETRTGTSISASAFGGSLKGKSVVGGILGCSGPNAGNVTDCHVDADIAGNNIVGGIVGEIDTRILVDRCHVEGTLAASKTFGTSYVGKGYAVGGVAGSVANYYEPAEAAGEEAKPTDVITNCVVNIESITTPALPEGSQKSVHRIAGFTSINNLEPDWENIEDGKPIDKYLPTSTDPGLKNNYVVSALEKVDADVESAANTTEGADIEPTKVDSDFLATLGYKFGETDEMPWQAQSESNPTLYHEGSAKFLAAEMDVLIGKPFDADLVIVSRKPLTEEEFIDGFACEISDEQVVEMNGSLALKNNVATIGFNALKEGTAEFTANVNGSLAKVKFNVVTSLAAIDEIQASGSKVSIKFADMTVTAENALIEVYALDGKKVATGSNSLSLASLAKGFYVVKATDGAGASATAKFLLQ